MMRLVTAILLTGLTLAATASAAPIDDRVGVIETAYAPVAKAGGALDAADPARATPSSDRSDATQAGNPLSKIPLSALAAIHDRPLFSVSRRPPAPAIQIIAQPVQEPAPAPPPPPERPAVKLIGTVLSPAASVALLRDPATQAVTRLRVGEATSGWRVKTVSLRSVVLQKGEQSAILGLPEARNTPGEQPSPNSPPPIGRTSLR